MKISIDLDGTLWQNMAFFRNLMTTFQAAGHDVGILTGHHMNGKYADIAKLSENGFPLPSFFYGKETDQDMATNGSYFKSRKIKECGIDIHFDDCDYGNLESEQIFIREGIMEKVFKVQFKVSHSHHCE